MAGKFAGLEGVVLDQPEVFETPCEAPTEGPVVATTEGEAAGSSAGGAEAGGATAAPTPKEIDESSINADAAYAKFRGTGGAVGLRGPDGAYLMRDEYSIAAGRAAETLEQRYNRLRQEFEEFDKQVTAAKAATSGSSSSDGGDDAAAGAVTVVAISEQVALMQKQLQQVNLDQVLGGTDSVAADDVPGLQAELTKRLLAEIGKFKSGKAAATTATGKAEGTAATTTTTEATTATTGGNDVVTYELHYRPEHARHAQESAIGTVEAKVHALEKLVGGESLEGIATFLNMPTLTLKAAVEGLARRVDAISEDSLADLDRRLQNVVKGIEEAKKRREESLASDPEGAAETAKKVSELYDTVKEWDEVASSVPKIVDRLHTLRALHEQGAAFGKSVTHIETVQKQLREELATQTVTLATVEESFKKNLSTIEANFASIDKRVAAITAKLS